MAKPSGCSSSSSAAWLPGPYGASSSTSSAVSWSAVPRRCRRRPRPTRPRRSRSASVSASSRRVGRRQLVLGRPGVHRLVDGILRRRGLPALGDAGAAGRGRRHAGAATPATGRPLRLFAAPLRSSSSSDMRATRIVMWQVRLRMRVARPRARGRKRSQRRALVGEAGGDVELVAALAVVVLGVGHGRRQHLADRRWPLAVGEAQHVVGRAARRGRGSDRAPARALDADAAQVLRREARVPCARRAWVAPSLVLRPVIADPLRSSPGRRGTGRCGWGRTRPACARPSTR